MNDSLPPAPVRVFVPCTGLGHQRRGFEAFMLDFARAMRDDRRVEITLFAGGAVHDMPARTVANVPRHTALARALGTVHGRGSYFTEQASFFLGFLPALVRERPDVVYYADLALGNLCFHWRRITGARYRLLYCNSGGTALPFTRSDFVQQVTAGAFHDAVARGEDPARQVVLPHGVQIGRDVPSRGQAAARAALGLPLDRPVVLSVGALNRYEKRTDYLLRELAALPEPRPFLCVLGQPDPDAGQLHSMAHELLGAEHVAFRTVPHDEMALYYRAADLFVSASLYEAFGIALVEAMASGIPLLVHDSAHMRELTGEAAYHADLTRDGNGTRGIIDALGAPDSDSDRAARHRLAYDHYSWDMLRDRYVELLLRTAKLPRTTAPMRRAA